LLPLAGLPNILFGIELIPGALAAVFLVFMPGVFVYLITANSLFDIDFILDRIRYYSLLTLVPTAIFLLFLFYFVGEFTLVQKIQVVLVTYIGLIAFLYVKEELDFRFRTKLFKEKYNFQASLDRFTWFYSTLGKGLEVSIWLPINMITNVNEQGV